jgi:abequosyltransferase
MQPKLLTIIVPTYNRADCLALLLETLRQEIAGLEARVEVIVGDNASTDATPEVTAAFAARCDAAQVLRHPRNVGPEENFCLCLDRAESRFFWIIGDDDLPKPGVVAQVMSILQSHDPDLLALGSEWLPQLAGAADGTPVSDLTPLRASSEDFAAYVNVWVTFISGMVVHRQRLLDLHPGIDVRRFAGTSLVQLGWVLPMLASGNRLFVVPERCMLATSGNTGGYQLITVFATNLPKILDAVCGPASPQRRGIVRALAWNFVPGLLWLMRFGDAGRFPGEDVRESLRPLRGTAAYRLVVLPVLRLPKPFAFFFWMLSRLCGRAIRLFFADKIVLRAGVPRDDAGAATP